MSTATNNDNKNAAPATDHGSGYLEISEKGFGFLRTAENHFHPKPTDIFVTPDTIKRSFLREGSLVAGPTQPPHRGNSPQLKSVDKVNDMTFEDYTKSVRFENLTTIDPIEKFRLETTPDLIETRVIDMVTPLGKGTRGLIVAPPRTGKTTILKQIANAITANHPEVHVHGAAHRRAPGGSHRLPALREGRSGRLLQRPGSGNARAPLALHDRALPAHGGSGQGRLRAARLASPAWPAPTTASTAAAAAR